MTGGQLMDELARIAEAAPHVHVPDDLFARGRRATARARILVTAAAVTCIGLIAVVAAPLVRPDETSVADGGERAGVPDTIYAPPDADLSNLPEEAIEEAGPAVAAYLVDTLDGRVVVVTRDGRYLATRLPKYRDAAVDEVSPALSPDGTRLAYTSRHHGAPSLAIVDLAGGGTRHVRLAEPYGAAVRTLQWSPDSRWLTWSGQAVKELRADGASYRLGVIGGVIGSDALTSRSVPGVDGHGWDGAGICDDGTVLTYVWPKFASYDDGHSSLSRSWATATAGSGACAAPASYAAVADDGELIGWLPGADGGTGPTAVVLTPVYDEGSAFDSYRMELVNAGDGARTIGTVESTWVENLSVATGLMSEERPTVPAGESPWAPSWWEEHRSDLCILAILIAAPCLFVFFVRRRLRQ